MVLLSFSMQVFLLAFGSIRRRSSSAFLRLSLWLGYLLADSTAIYALGHLSVASSGGSSEHQLVSFWAPFLLLHLGGPDNITAYALEDNRLWKRHLQILIVQVLGAAYVTYKSMASGGTLLLLLASISMFVVGLAKYSERTWALKCSSISSIRRSLSYQESEDPCQLLTHDMSDEDILLVAHRSLHICKAAFTDFPVRFGDGDKNCYGPMVSQYKLVEMELSLMYDALYTKAAVMHTRYGFWIRIVSVLGTVTAFLLFHLHLTRTSSRKNNNGYNRGDVTVSYVLLVGALLLEAVSLCKALVSSWTCSLVHHSQRWEWLLHALTFLGRRVQPASSRLWQGSIGQYNLFHLCTRDRKKLGSRLAEKMRLEDWWNKLHFTSTFTPTVDFKELVHEAVPLPFNCDPRGTSILKKKGLIKSLDLDPLHFGKDFNESILIWSIVTEKCIHLAKDKQQQEEEEQCKLIQAIEVLSNYLMFLLVVKPEMLPDPRPQKAHADLCHVWDKIWRSLHHGDDEYKSSAASHRSWNPFNVLKGQFQRLNELLHQDGPHASRIKQRKELVSNIFNPLHENEVSSLKFASFYLFLSHCTGFCHFQYIYRTTYFISEVRTCMPEN